MSQHQRSRRLRPLFVVPMLAALAVIFYIALTPRCCSERGPTPETLLKGELRRIATAQELHYVRADRYGTVNELDDYHAREGVVVVADSAGPNGWSMTLGHATAEVECSLTVSTGEPGDIDCIPESRPPPGS